jgi:hypothetical protein
MSTNKHAGPDGLCQYVLDRLPLRARLAGSERLNDIILVAATYWPSERLGLCSRGSAEEEKMLDHLRADVARTYESLHGGEKRYGFFWAFILSAAISGIVQFVLEWWLKSHDNQKKMFAWQLSEVSKA